MTVILYMSLIECTRYEFTLCIFCWGLEKRCYSVVEEKMIKRLSRESIVNYIQFGGDPVKFATKSFDERVEVCDTEIKKIIDELGLIDEQSDRLLSNVCLLTETYLDEGIKIGVNLLLNLMR
jgi:hypothetical protein